MLKLALALINHEGDTVCDALSDIPVFLDQLKELREAGGLDLVMQGLYADDVKLKLDQQLNEVLGELLANATNLPASAEGGD